MNKMELKNINLKEFLGFQKKSKVKAGDGSAIGKYKFFTSSNNQKKFIDEFLFEGEFLIFGSGGLASIHYVNEKFSTSTDCFICNIENSNILTKYIYYYLFGNKYLLEKGFKGAGLKHISKDYISSIKIPIPINSDQSPNLAYQEKVVKELEKIETAIEKKKKAIELNKEYLESLFYDMFGSPIKNEKGFEKGKIKDLLISTNYGSGKKADETKGEFPMLRMNNINYDGSWNFSSLKYVDLNEKEQEKYLVYDGELLFNRTNSKKLVGKTAVFRKKTPMAFAGYLIKLKTKNKSISEFISAYLNCPVGKSYLFRKCKSIVGMANINAQEIQEFPILLPSQIIMDKFAKEVEKYEKIREKQEESLNKLNDLFNSSMQKAFKGEL